MTPDAILSDIHQRIAALGDGRDARSDNERASYRLAYGALDRRRMAIRDSVPDLAQLAPQIAAVTAWLEHLRTWRAEWQKELDALLPAEQPSREEHQRILVLTEVIRQVDNGVHFVNSSAQLSGLLREKICSAYTPTWDGPRDPWAVGFGSIRDSEAKLAALTRKRDVRQSQLDAALREPEAVST